MTRKKRVIWALLLALFFLPAGATIVHFRIHSDVAWLPYLTLFDAIVVTALFYFRKTSPYALFLNTIFVVVGVGYHLQVLPGGWADILMSLTDLLAGYAVYVLVTAPKALVEKKEQTNI